MSNVWAVKKDRKLVAVCMSKDAGWGCAASLMSPLSAGMPTRHEVMSQGFSVVAARLEYSPDPARHYVRSRTV